MGAQPIGADIYSHVDSESIEGQSLLHFADNEVAHFGFFGTVEIKYQFVVHLQYHLSA